MVGFLRVWKPRTLMTLNAAPDAPALRRHSAGAVLKAWSPFAVASLLILLWALPAFAKYIRFDALSFPLRGLHNLAIRVPPVVPTPTGETAIMATAYQLGPPSVRKKMRARPTLSTGISRASSRGNCSATTQPTAL